MVSSRIRNCLLGCAVGDSLGLPLEGLSAARAAKLFPGPLSQRMWFARGFLSDDTLQSIFVAQALLLHPHDPIAFQRALGKRLALWFLSIPPGIGLNTIKACLRLVLRVPAERAGLPSAGNGAAMRAAVIGAYFPTDLHQRRRFAEASAKVTHTHPLAVMGSCIVADLAAGVPEEQLRAEYRDWPFNERFPERGPTGYVVHTVNAVLEVLRQPLSFEEAITRAVRLGGDTDTVAAIVGGILGAREMPVPEEWQSWVGWPQPRQLLVDTAPPYARLLAQHLFALPIILGYGFRRILPPY